MMKKLFEKLGEKKFKIYATICLILGDGIIFYWIYKHFSQPELFKKLLTGLATVQPNIKSIMTSGLENELYHLMINTLILMITLFAIFHLIVYFLFHKKTNLTKHYISLISWTAAPSCIYIGIVNLSSNTLLNLFLIIQGFLYFFVALGVIHIKKISSNIASPPKN